jgi:hypothetical protein
LAGAVGAFLFGSEAANAQADPHRLSGDELLRTTCLDRLNSGTIAFDRTIALGTTRTGTHLDPKPQSDPCDGYSWVRLAPSHGFVQFHAAYNGPDINRFSDSQNEWDCEHSNVEYAVYVWVNNRYQRAYYANLYGRYANGHCYHDGSGFASVGNPVSSFYSATVPVVAIKSWQHNAADFEHTTTYCTGDNCYWPSYLAVDPELYEYCSQEGQICSFSGTREVRYGANGSFSYGMASRGIACENTGFGDPASGQVKSCYTGLRGFNYCAKEGSNCSFSGTKTVAFGARGKFAYKQSTNGAACSNSVFGDPISGVAKSCYVQK